MNILSTAKTFEPARFGIAALFGAVFVSLTILLCGGLVLMKHAQAFNPERMPVQIKAAQATGQSAFASEILGDDRPTLILFYPVEVCQRRYCLTPEAVEARLIANDLTAVNLVNVPVYAVPVESGRIRPVLPLLGWDVYAVEPYLNWLPPFSETVYGRGLETPVVALIAPDGAVLYRGDEYFTVEELRPYVEPSAPSATAATVDSRQ